MNRALKLSCLVFLTLAGIAGCSDAKPTNSVENANDQAIADYDKMIADEAAAMSDQDAADK